MTEKTESAPPKQPFLRKVLFFLLAFAVSLALGRAFEYITSEKMQAAGLEWQQEWFNSVSTMAPLSLASNYFQDVLQLGSSGIAPHIAEPEKQTEKAEDKSDETEPKGAVQCRLLPAPERLKQSPAVDPVLENLAQTKENECLLLSLTRKGCLQYQGTDYYSTCTAEQDRINEQFERECAGWEAGINRQFEQMSELRRMEFEQRQANQNLPKKSPPSLGERASAPLRAIYYTWLRLTAAGGISYFWAVLQLGAGLLGFLALYGLLFGDRQQRRYLPEGFLGWTIGLPFGTIIVASISAMILKYLMLSGLYLFCEVTHLAALCCGATGILGLCWYWGTKLAEFSAGSVLTPQDPKN